MEAVEKGQDGSANAAQEHCALKVEEQQKIEKMIGYTCIGDDLDSAV